MSVLTSFLFLGGWSPYFIGFYVGVIVGVILFVLKIILILFAFVWVRAAFPRYRYDQLMRLGWKVILPLSFGWLMLGFVTVYLI